MSKYFRLQEGWLTVGLLALLLFSVTLSIQQAQWSDGLTILTPITVIGLLTGVVLAKARGVPRFLLDLLGIEIGFLTVLISVASVMHDPSLTTVQARVHNLVERTVSWVNVAVKQEVSDDLVVFVLSLAVVSWVLSYSSAYFVFRSRQLWWALVPNGIALLINLSYSPVNLNNYIVIFMFSALLLMIRFNLLLKEERWQRERVNYSPTLTWPFLLAGSATSVVLALTMWWVPASAANSTLNGMWEKVNKPWVDFQNTMSKLWSTVPGNQNIGGYASFNREFTMGGALNLSDAVAFTMVTNERIYMRARTYDDFDGAKWSSTSQDTFQMPNLSSFLALDANQQLASDDEQREEITYTVTIANPKDDILLAPARAVKLTTPSRLEISWRQIDETYNIDDFYRAQNPLSTSIVPLELRGLIGTLNEAESELKAQKAQSGGSSDDTSRLYNTARGASIQKQQEELQQRGIATTVKVEADNAVTLHVSGQVPVYDDISSIHAPDNLSRGSEYGGVSLASTATDAQLQAVNVDYSLYPWLAERYLQLPTSTSQRTKDLALQIVRDAGATNAFDEARAIEAYLRANYTYSTNIGQPPSGIDRVDWFLFQNQKGYCEYYAGAMVVMLRSLGIPTRFAAGYAPGIYDKATNTWTVREASAHAWPEVYFPGYGWIQFEPTPSQPGVNREIGVEEPTVEPTPSVGITPVVSPTAPDPNHPNVDEQHPDAGTGATPTDPTFLGINMSNGTIYWMALSVAAVGVLAVVLLIARKRQPVYRNPGVYYGRMIAWARLLRLGPAEHQTPYEFSEALARELPGAGLFARTISRAYVKERYSRAAGEDEDRAQAGRAWDSLRGRLVRSLPRRRLKLKRRARRK